MIFIILILGITGGLLALTITYVGTQPNVMIPIAGSGMLALVIQIVSLLRKSSSHDIAELRKILLEVVSNVRKPPSPDSLNLISEKIAMQIEKFFADLANGTIIDQGLKAIIEQDYKTAVTLFEKNTKVQPKEAALSWFLEGNAHYFQGDFGEAVIAYQKSTNFNPRLAKAWYNWSEALKALGRQEEANSKFDKAVELDSSLANVEDMINPALDIINAQEAKMGKYQQTLEMETELAKI